MLSLTPGSACDICLEEYGAHLPPHALPCGHLLCALCCNGIIENMTADTGCPYCREPFEGAQVRKLRVDFPSGASTSATRSGSVEDTRPVEILNRPAPHRAYCNLCNADISGIRFKCTKCPDFDACQACFHTIDEVHPTHTFVKVRAQADYVHPSRFPRGQNIPHNAHCHECGSQIFGVRYTCATCPSHDLCEHCEAHPLSVHPREHVLLKRVMSGPLPMHLRPISDPRHPMAVAPPPPPPPVPGARAAWQRRQLEGTHPRLAYWRHREAAYENPDAWENGDDELDEREPRRRPQDIRHGATCDACGQPILGIRYKCMHPACPDFDLCAACEADPHPNHPADHSLLKIRLPEAHVPEVARFAPVHARVYHAGLALAM